MKAKLPCGLCGGAPTGVSSVPVHELDTLIRNEPDRILADQRCLTLGHRLGLSEHSIAALRTALSELTNNILRYAGRGTVRFAICLQEQRRGIQITAEDRGPGIADLAAALRDGYSTGGSLGVGLPGARRLVDRFSLSSAPGRGTTVRLQKWG